ncbi:unnamed protein product [Sphagnum balticum]
MSDNKVGDAMATCGHDCFFPQIEKLIWNKQGHKSKKTEPLWRGYQFVKAYKFQPIPDLREVRARLNHNNIYFLKDTTGPLFCRSNILSQLESVADNTGTITLRQVNAWKRAIKSPPKDTVFQPNAALVVTGDGPFYGQLAKFIKLVGNEKDRCQVLLEILGRKTVVELDIDDVEVDHRKIAA